MQLLNEPLFNDCHQIGIMLKLILKMWLSSSRSLYIKQNDKTDIYFENWNIIISYDVIIYVGEGAEVLIRWSIQVTSYHTVNYRWFTVR